MAKDSVDGSVLIASVNGSSWYVQRAGPGGVEELISADDGSTELGSVRGIVALGGESALITVGDSLIKLSYPQGQAPLATELFSPATANGPLQTPWGLALDPLDTDRVFVAEKGADRVVAIELSSLKRTVLPATGDPIPAPEHIALENSGARLLVVTDADELDGVRELRAIDLSETWDAPGPALESYELIPGIGQAPALPEPVGGVAAGPEGLRLVALTASNDLAVGGGVEQVRTITSYEHDTQTVFVDDPFDPPFEAGDASRPWRMREYGAETISATPEGATRTFLWDSADADGTEVELRIVPIDTDVGLADSTGGARTVFPYFGGDVATMGNQQISAFPRVVRAGDLDGDGDLDVVTVNEGIVAGFTLFFQTDPGEFTPGETIGDPNLYAPTYDVELADLDGDGDLDLVGQYGFHSFGTETRAVSILFQTSPGVFGDDTLIASTVQGVATADLDDDGDIDIVTQNGGMSPSIDVYFQEAPGVFGAPLVLTEYAIPLNEITGVAEVVMDLETDDLNADGNVDIYFVDGGSVVIYLQTGPGLFALSPLVTPSEPAMFASSHDVDLDGDVDLVVSRDSAMPGGGKVMFMLQTSPGVFEEGPVVTDGLPGPVLTMTLGDLDADGDVDLVTGNNGNPNVTVFFQDDQGEFTRQADFHHPSSLVYDVGVADVDGDGALDILTADGQANAASVLFGGNQSDFGEGPQVGSTRVSPGIRGVVQGDMDGDGDLDLVTSNRSGNSLTVFLQGAPGAYAPHVTIPLQGANEGVDLGDLDRDGDLDIVAALAGAGLTAGLAVFLQESPDEYVAQPVLSIPTSAATPFVDAVDVDGDGDLDLVSVLFGPGSDMGMIAVYLATTPAQFEEPIVLGEGSSVASTRCEVVDIDSDGDLDIATAHWDTGDISIFHQVATGVFELTTLAPGGPPVDNNFEVFADDMDGNGAPDLLVLKKGFGPVAASVVLRHQTSGGAFLDGAVIASLPMFGGQLRALSVGDLDGDRDKDIVVSAFVFPPAVETGLIPYMQVRPDAFVVRPSHGADLGLLSSDVALIGDFDSDEDLDLAMNDGTNGFVQIFFGSH
jgi:hypothetical protein